MTTFGASVDRLIGQVAHWEQPRWWARPQDGQPTHGDRFFALVQRVADLGADAEHRPRRAVPRLGDMSLPDQLRVMADDLLTADPAGPVLAEAAAAVDALRPAL